jgi:hypothetical protein
MLFTGGSLVPVQKQNREVGKQTTSKRPTEFPQESARQS